MTNKLFNREGQLTTDKKSCLGCKWHHQKMRRSGNPAIYEYSCAYGKLQYIGIDMDTPEWCPVLNDNNNETKGKIIDKYLLVSFKDTKAQDSVFPDYAQEYIDSILNGTPVDGRYVTKIEVIKIKYRTKMNYEHKK